MENLKYTYFQLGRKAEESSEYLEAIQYFLKYHENLDKKDGHIPFLWIYQLYTKLNDFKNAEEFLYKFCEGCTYPYAITVLKNQIPYLESIGQIDLAARFQKKASFYNKMNKENLK